MKKRIIIISIVAILVIATGVTIPVLQSKGYFCKGNSEKYSVANTKAFDDSPIKDKTIVFLGSSVTHGSAAKGESFVDFIEKEDGIIAVKEAVSGTTLIDVDENSYVSRLKNIDKSIKPDALVCQLSTNDAKKSKHIPLGEISESYDINNFDTSTIIGAMEYIIAYSYNRWNCPVVFYTGTKYNNDKYAQMVDALLKLKDKWGISVVDLWNSEKMNSVSSADYKLYMANGIHPSRAGYKLWWAPEIRQCLYGLLG